MHIGMQNLLSREQDIHVSLNKTYLDKLDKFIFQKKDEDSFIVVSLIGRENAAF